MSDNENEYKSPVYNVKILSRCLINVFARHIHVAMSEFGQSNRVYPSDTR